MNKLQVEHEHELLASKIAQLIRARKWFTFQLQTCFNNHQTLEQRLLLQMCINCCLLSAQQARRHLAAAAHQISERYCCTLYLLLLPQVHAAHTYQARACCLLGICEAALLFLWGFGTPMQRWWHISGEVKKDCSQLGPKLGKPFQSND